MGIRQSINENPAITTGVTAGIILLAIIFMVYYGCSKGGTTGSTVPGLNNAFFSTDDGKTWFVDDATNIPPYAVSKAGPNAGKTAVRAQVFKCGDGQPFVAHLEKYSEEDKKKLQEAMAKANGKGAALPLMYMSMGSQMMVKKPGDANWVKLQQGQIDKYTAVMQPKCKDGSTTGQQRVNPE